MFALVVVENKHRGAGRVSRDAFFCSTQEGQIFSDVLANVAERLNIAQRFKVVAKCEGYGKLSAETSIDSIAEYLDGGQLTFTLRFVKPSSKEGILYYPPVTNDLSQSLGPLARNKTVLRCR